MRPAPFLLRPNLGWGGLVILSGLLGRAAPTTNQAPDLVWVPDGLYRPLFRADSDPKEIPVPGFWIETRPVTEGQYLHFVRTTATWRRSRVRTLFADSGYLKHWSSDLDPGTNLPAWTDRPVVNISWFAAKAYASSQGRRLPTTAEWERVAAAGFTILNGAADVAFQRAVAQWYGSPSPPQLAPVASHRANYYGIYDLHGLVWEWTSDFNAALGVGDARSDTGLERQLFCGAGSLGATDRANYPAYMREGFRSSLKAAYTINNLGFRCALSP